MLPSIVALVLIRLWLMPLPSSFWIDEMGTVFVVQRGADDPSLKVAPQVSESIYFSMVRLAERVLGDSEPAYRILSIFAMGAALWFVFQIAARLIRPEAGWFAVLTCLALRGINIQAADARPYALGTCVAAGSILLLIRWLDSGRFLDGLFFCAGASLLWRVHLIFWPFYLVYAIYAIARIGRKETAVRPRGAAIIFALLGVSLIPVAANALALYRQAAAHVIVPDPSFGDLVTELKVGLVAGSCTLAVLAARWFRWPQNPEPVCSRSSLLLIICWWITQPICLFLFSWLTGNSVFVPRYLSICLPGAALMATIAAAPFFPEIQWRRVSVALAAGIFLFLGQWGRLWPVHEKSDWKKAATTIHELGIGPDVPVICPSPFIEARPPAWKPDYSLPGFLYAHLAIYPIPGKIYPFPFETSSVAEKYAARLSQDTLARSGRFVIYGGDHNVLFWRDWFTARPELLGWSKHRLGPFGDVDVMVFESPDSGYIGERTR